MTSPNKKQLFSCKVSKEYSSQEGNQSGIEDDVKGLIAACIEFNFYEPGCDTSKAAAGQLNCFLYGV